MQLYILIHGLWPMVWPGGQGIGKKRDGKISGK